VAGKLRAFLIASLQARSLRVMNGKETQGLLDFVPNLRVRLVPIPNTDDILVRPDANGTTTYPRPLIWLFVGRRLEIIELFPKNCEDKVFPQTI